MNESTITSHNALILSELDAENTTYVNKISDNECDPLFKDTCTDNESDSVNKKKRHISNENENSDEEILHANKKYKSCASDEQSIHKKQISNELDVLPSETPSSINVTKIESEKLLINEENTSIHEENKQHLKECLPEEKNNEQKFQESDKTELSKIASDISMNNDTNSESEDNTLNNVYTKVLNHIETTKVSVCCERMNFEKFIRRQFPDEISNSNSKTEETTNNQETAKIRRSGKVGPEDEKTKKSTQKESKKSNMKFDNLNSEFMDCDDGIKNDTAKINNNINSKISEKEISNMININFNDDNLSTDNISGESENGPDTTIGSEKVSKSSEKIKKTKLNKDSDKELKSRISNQKLIKNLSKTTLSNSESDNSDNKKDSPINNKNMTKKLSKTNGNKFINSESKNEPDNKLKSNKKLSKNSSKIKSVNEEFETSNSEDSGNESESYENRKIRKKSEKLNKGKVADASELRKSDLKNDKNDSKIHRNNSEILTKKSQTASLSNNDDSESEQSDKGNERSGDSEYERDEKSEEENCKSSGSESKNRTKKLSKKSPSNKNETDTESEDDDTESEGHKSDIDDQKIKTANFKKVNHSSGDDYKPKRDPEKRIKSLKKYLHIAGIRINNFQKFFENIKTNVGKERKLLGLLQEKGLKGRPTIKKCKQLRKKIEIEKDIAELNISKVIVTDGRPKRQASNQTQRRLSTSDSNTYQQTYNRIRALVDSDSD